MRFFSSISVINIVKSKRILLKMRIKTDVAVTVLNRYCDITFLLTEVKEVHQKMPLEHGLYIALQLVMFVEIQ